MRLSDFMIHLFLLLPFTVLGWFVAGTAYAVVAIGKLVA